MFKNMDEGHLITGGALILAASALTPVIGNTLRPFMILGVKGALNIIDSTKTAVRYAQEEVEDIIAEAQFERMKTQFDQELCLQKER